MTLPDVNVLMYAYDAGSPFHERALAWLESEVNGAAFGMSPQALCSAVRILTNPRAVKSPEPLEKVLAFADALLAQPNCERIAPGARHWRIFCELCRQSDTKGGLVQDAWFAALAIEWGCEWITLDRDYARFEGLRWRTPF